MFSGRSFQTDGAETENRFEWVQCVFSGRRVSARRSTLGNVCWCVGAAANPDTMASTSSVPCTQGAPPWSRCASALATSAVTAVVVWKESDGSTVWRPVPKCFGPAATCRWSMPTHRVAERCSSPVIRDAIIHRQRRLVDNALKVSKHSVDLQINVPWSVYFYLSHVCSLP